MDVLGHSQIAVTMNTYAHVYDEAKKDAALKMDAAIASVSA
jgi:integrase